ncbi:MAG: hypothetical protein WCJ39_07120, partial [bacterium]
DNFFAISFALAFFSASVTACQTLLGSVLCTVQFLNLYLASHSSNKLIDNSFACSHCLNIAKSCACNTISSAFVIFQFLALSIISSTLSKYHNAGTYLFSLLLNICGSIGHKDEE